jgi:hypothetical protein
VAATPDGWCPVARSGNEIGNDERYERPGAGAVEKLGGRPAGCGDGVDDGATMATTSAPPNWDDVLRRGRAADVGSAPDVASAAAARRARPTLGRDGGWSERSSSFAVPSESV